MERAGKTEGQRTLPCKQNVGEVRDSPTWRRQVWLLNVPKWVTLLPPRYAVDLFTSSLKDLSPRCMLQFRSLSSTGPERDIAIIISLEFLKFDSQTLVSFIFFGLTKQWLKWELYKSIFNQPTLWALYGWLELPPAHKCRKKEQSRTGYQVVLPLSGGRVEQLWKWIWKRNTWGEKQTL